MADTPRTRISVEITAGKSGSSPIPGHFRLMDINVKKDINKIPEATLTYADGGVAEREKFEVADSGLFDKGNKVIIKAGYNSTTETIFEGIVDASELTVDKLSKFVVKCYNQAHPLTSISMGKDLTLKDKNMPEAIKTVLSEQKDVKSKVTIASKPDPSSLKKPQIVVDPFKTCWDFMKENLACYIAIPEDDLLKVEVPDFKQAADKEVEITYGKNLRNFKVKENTGALQSLAIKGFDQQKAGEKLETEQKVDALYKDFEDHMNDDTKKYYKSIKEIEVVSGSHIHTKADIDFITEVKKTVSMMNFKTGTISIHGDSKVKLATIVEVVGLPESYSPKFFVGGVEHKIGRDWETIIKVGSGASGGLSKLASGSSGGGGSSNQSDPAGSSTTGAKLSGNLTIGIVQSIHKDEEEGLYKIEVMLPKLMDTIVTARVLQPYAGAGDESKPGEGTFFFPNKGAEVVLTPLEGDENNWLVIGSLYSPTNKPSEELKLHGAKTQPDEDNAHKSIVTKDFILDFFDGKDDPRFMIASRDDGKKMNASDKKYSIAMHIKKEPHITVIYDKTKIVMDKEGVLVDSAKNIVLKADSGDIEMSAKNIKIDGTADVTINGQNIKAAAKTNFNVEGMQVAVKGKTQVNVESSATAAFKGSAMTNIG
ncbi:MAG TPA: hypothetical protein DCS93_35425 [Microscillaceae bacterium]|nr:hypothetical protein [Microscillaceae bacterium]